MQPKSKNTEVKLKFKRKMESEDSYTESNTADLKIKHKLKPVKSNKRSRNTKHKKLFKEEAFSDVDNVKLPKRKKKNKQVDSEVTQLLNTSNSKVDATMNGKVSVVKKKKNRSNSTNTETKHLLDDSTEENKIKGSHLKKSKKRKHVALEKDLAISNVLDKIKKKKKQKNKTNEIEEKRLIGAEQIKKKQKGKKQNTLEQSMLEDDGTKIDKPKVQRTSPNAIKFLFINLIKSILQKKLNLSKSKLKKKVLKKFCKVMGAEEKPEFVQQYEKSLMLTYGIVVLEDSVKLK
ncbi:hypothetical protein RN001_010160 [Aquatica leii]|uniref:Uncharacterized protein n=1 Tax=Aquatica leii TaxID=1421715 RepID=A0AAN7PUH5_9COLE|nr:hypothetical protein RN001_010160 [Aquatica leii]